MLAGALAASLLPLSAGRAQGVMRITIVRTSENGGSTTGELYVDGQFIAHTLELPWRNNASYISAIPAGAYPAHLRYDKSDGWRIQLDNVPGRSGVQIHVGNYPSQIEGCVLVGTGVVNSENRVEDSGAAYDRLRNAFYGSTNPNASPLKDVIVEVRYPPGRTELRSSLGARWVYDGSGRWLYGDEALLNMEYRRDLRYVYVRYRGPNMFFRFPLFGNAVESYASRADGPWNTGEGFYTRVN